MATASGQVTNAVFGFTSMLINLMKDHEPDHIAVAFDRLQLFPDNQPDEGARWEEFRAAIGEAL